MAGKDKVIGLVLLGIAAFVFGYYSVWTLVLPFVPPGNALFSYFPARQYAILIPIALLTVALSFVVTFITYTIMQVSNKKKKDD